MRYPRITTEEWYAGWTEKGMFFRKICFKFLAVILIGIVFLIFANIAFADETIETFTGSPTGQHAIWQTSNHWWGQSFTTAGAGDISTIGAYLEDDGTSPTGNVILNIYACDGSGFPTGSALGVSENLAASAITGTPTLHDFTFSSAVAVAAATKYCLVLTRDTSFPDTTDYIVIDGNSSNVYADGTKYLSNTTITSGYSVPTDRDLAFRITVTTGGGGGGGGATTTSATSSSEEIGAVSALAAVGLFSFISGLGITVWIWTLFLG